MFKKPRVYLDYAAATPLSKAAFSSMEPFLIGTFGNASAIHQEGVLARKAVEEARDKVAQAIQVRPEFVTFTSGGTESNNLAIIGVLERLHSGGLPYAEMEVVTTMIEHPSVMKTMKMLKQRGVIVKYVGVDSEGFVKLEELQKLLSPKTVLFSVAYANSEIGVVQKVHGIKKPFMLLRKSLGRKFYFISMRLRRHFGSRVALMHCRLTYSHLM